MYTKRCAALLSIFVSLLFARVMVAQPPTFTQTNLSTSYNYATYIHASDINGDGYTDILTASYALDRIDWWANNGSQFFTQTTVMTGFARPRCIHAADVDNDGDIDVLAASETGDIIAWFDNNNLTFSQNNIATGFDGAMSVYAVDLDGDGDMDVLGAANAANDIYWYENDGSQTFTPHSIDLNFTGAASVYAADVEGDGDIDVIASGNGTVAWWENDGNQGFGTAINIASGYGTSYSVYAKDIDGDGDIDVLSCSSTNNSINWYENNGAGLFTPQLVGAYTGAWSVYAADMDNDGDVDILSASRSGGNFSWWENNGSQSFTQYSVATVTGAMWVYATDVDLDGDTDFMGAALNANTVAWFENSYTPLAGGVSKDVVYGAWEFIGIPVNVVDGDALVLFGDDLGMTPGYPYWRLSRWDPLWEKYVRYGEPDQPPVGGDQDPADFEPGLGYWLYQEVASPVTLDIEFAQLTGVVNQSVPYVVGVIDAVPGREIEMLANPFNYTYDWRSTRIRDTASPVTYSIYEAAQNNVCDGYGYAWDVANQQYKTVNFDPDSTANYNLDAWEGVWFEHYGTAGSMYVHFIPASMMDNGVPAKSNGDRDNVERWSAQLIVSTADNQYTDENNIFGATTVSSDKYDYVDAREFTPMGSHFVQLYFEHEDWGDFSGKYTYDFRSTNLENGQKTWEFTVRAYNLTNREIEVSWAGVDEIPDRMNLEVESLDFEMEAVNMRTANSFSFISGSETDAEYNFRVTASSSPVIGGEGGAAASVPAEFGLLETYPNPFNNEIRIDFSLNEYGKASLKVFNILGCEIADLSQAGYTVGKHSVIWNAAQQTSGIYFVRMESGGKVDTRKIVLLR